MTSNGSNQTSWRPYRLIGFGILLATLVVALAAAFVQATDIFLILFLGLLFSVFLTHASRKWSGWLPLGYKGSLATVVICLLLATTGALYFFGSRIDQQITKASRHMDTAQSKLQQLAEQHPAIGSTISSTPFLRDLLPEKSDQKSEKSSEQKAQPASEQERSDDNSANSDAASGDDSPQNNQTQSDANQSQSSSGNGPVVQSVAGRAARMISSIFQTTFGLLVNSVLIFFVGLFIAVSPENYRDGVVLLFPPQRRDRTREVMNTLSDTLWQWLTGRFGSMAVTGAGAAILLGALQVPMGISLGILTGLLTFVPNIGSLVSLVLATLFALPQGFGIVLGVVGGYMALQLVESYVITPLIQQKQASLPPALLISTQAVMGVLFGFLGAAVASPLLAAVKKGVEEVYICDVLDDPDKDSESD